MCSDDIIPGINALEGFLNTPGFQPLLGRTAAEGKRPGIASSGRQPYAVVMSSESTKSAPARKKGADVAALEAPARTKPRTKANCSRVSAEDRADALSLREALAEPGPSVPLEDVLRRLGL